MYFFLLDLEFEKHGINSNLSKSYKPIAVIPLLSCNGINRDEINSLNFSVC